MSDALVKLRILWLLAQEAYVGWKASVWSRDLDSLYCCDGRECCCGGMTVREAYWGTHRDR